MRFKLLNLNEKNKVYQFDLSDLSLADWEIFMEDIAVGSSEGTPKRLKIIQASVTIRENVAKIKMSYENDSFHEVSLSVDRFGVLASGYTDFISQMWQKIMTARFGKNYSNELNANLQNAELN